MKQTILESQHDHHQLLLDESKYKKHLASNSSEYARQREREQREGLEHLGLSEVEAVEYVLMLSRDEANANPKAESGSGTSTSETQFEDQAVFEGDFDTEHNTDNEEEDDRYRNFTHSTVSGSRRSSISSTSIPTTWSSSHSSSSSSASISSRSSHSNLTTVTRTISTELTTTADRRSIPRPIPYSSNEKVQVSSPSRAEPTEAGEEWLVGYNPVRLDPGSSSGDTHTSAEVELEARIFPPIVPDGIRNTGDEAQGPKGEDDENNSKRQNDLRRKKKNKNRKDNIEDTRKDKSQGGDKGKISLNSISDADAGNKLTSPPSSSTSFTSASTSAWNIPSSTGRNYGQRRASNISSPSSSASASVSAAIAPRNAWTSGGPSLSARISPPTAAATSSLHYHHHYQQQQGGRRVVTAMNPDTDMDEDLKLAIELSLAEARSRGEDV